MTHEMTNLLATRPVELDGRSLGMLATGGAETAPFLGLLITKLKKRHFLTAVVRVDKPGDREPGPAQLLDQLAARCDVVLAGVVESVEAAAALASDAANFERLGLPCAVVVTADLASSTRRAMSAQGFDDIGSVVALGGRLETDPAAVQALVDGCYRAVESALTSSQAAGPRPNKSVPTQRNGEVSCEC